MGRDGCRPEAPSLEVKVLAAPAKVGGYPNEIKMRRRIVNRSSPKRDRPGKTNIETGSDSEG